MHWIKQHTLSPKHFYRSSGYVLPWLVGLFIISFGYGLIDGLFIAPPDYQQGDGFRIMYIHVPSAFLAMSVYSVMAISALMTLVFRMKVAAVCMSSSAKIGVWFTALALITGSIWGKPMWGTWWIWDARLTSVLILFFLYLGFIALESAITDPYHRDRACAIIALVGFINIPIIHYSVDWWNTLHQGASISKFAKPSIAPAMLYPLLAMIVAFFLFYGILLILRMRTQLLERDAKSQWVREVILNEYH